MSNVKFNTKIKICNWNYLPCLSSIVLLRVLYWVWCGLSLSTLSWQRKNTRVICSTATCPSCYLLNKSIDWVEWVGWMAGDYNCNLYELSKPRADWNTYHECIRQLPQKQKYIHDEVTINIIFRSLMLFKLIKRI